MAFALVGLGFAQDKAQTDQGKAERPQEKPKVKLGLAVNDPQAFQGYTLLSTMMTKKAYLIDMQGRVVKTWKADRNSLHCSYLLENGNLLRPTDLGGDDRSFGGGPGSLGRVQEITWDGEIAWDYKLFNDKQLFHHDLTKLPSGNYLFVVWDKKTGDESVAAGRKPALVDKYLLPDSLVEVKPTGKTSGEVVWEWHLWDHLIQDADSSKANYGDVAAHPELVDINYVDNPMPAPPPTQAAKKDDTAKLKTIGYVASPASQAQRVNPDWTHVNSVDYNPDLDQVMLSVHEFSEVWIIDHGTTTAEAADHKGGRQGKGGDLLYRWGNPHAYRAGTKADQRLFAQHNAQWIDKGLPGAGHMLVFNNGPRRPDGNYSSIDEVVLPVDAQGRYERTNGSHFGPDQAVWSYSAPKKPDFYSTFISGTHRLPNGNTQICSGANGTIFEVTPDKEIVWKYLNPAKGGFGPGRGGPGGPPRPGEVLPGFVQDMLALSAEQKKDLDTFQKEVDGRMDKMLTAEQKDKLKPQGGPGPGPGPGGFRAMPQPGQLVPTTTQVTLKLSAEQKGQLTDLQKDVDARLEKLLTDDQKKQFKQFREDFARGGPPGGRAGGPGPPPGAPPGGPGGPGGGPPAFMFAGPPGGASLFRAYRYGPDYPGLAGKDLKPGPMVEELEKDEK
jgi:hypothetical protein